MVQETEKAREILKKNFCFMQWQTDDAEKRGEKVMEKEDVEFLLSLDGMTYKEISRFETPIEKEGYDSEKLFESIKKAAKGGYKGITLLWKTLTHEDVQKVKGMGYFIQFTGHGSTQWDEIYFSEEAFLRSKISYFKNLFGCIETLVVKRLI